KFVDAAGKETGFFSLAPIRKLAEESLIPSLLGGVKLRMAVVGMRSGQIKYVSETGRLLDDPKLPSDDSGSPQVGVIDGMLASAAIPVFLEAQNLAGDLYVDGGLRQIAPVNAAAAMGANEIYTVVAPIVLQPLRPDEKLSGIFDIGSRAATDITIDEITS